MARAAIDNQPLQPDARFARTSGIFWFQPMPKLEGKLGQMYSSHFPDRMKNFQAAQEATNPIAVIVDVTKKDNLESWSHALYHDAESVFWMMVWWVVNAIPEGQSFR